ncbi:MAG: helicase-related protein, partial [Pseudanabaena sp.]
DTKRSEFIKKLRQESLERDSAIVFTQYTDTMDYLRDTLLQLYGSQVACYSGRGGELYQENAWQIVPKEEIKRRFRDGEIKLLLCTESASEGLNLQTCGVLFNYDMPWNPMRVEQRIGRIDRIGQKFSQVRIHNFYYDGTVEAK